MWSTRVFIAGSQLGSSGRVCVQWGLSVRNPGIKNSPTPCAERRSKNKKFSRGRGGEGSELLLGQSHCRAMAALLGTRRAFWACASDAGAV